MRTVRASDPNRHTKVPRSPVTVVKAHPGTWVTALALAEGDHRRLEIQPNGEVVVHNKPIR